jgi:hypothetical protein
MPAGGNLVLIGSDRPLRPSALTRERGTTVLRGDQVREFAGDDPVLRDEYAPTDQLLSSQP